MKTRTFAYLILAAVFMAGCSTKQEAEYNKPADYWYQKIVKDIAQGELDAADDHFSSLSSEHANSLFLPEAMMILANAHMQEEEYLLAHFYLDEYIKRFATPKEREYAEFLKLKASFLGIKRMHRDQQLLLDTIAETHAFVDKYPQSKYRPYVETMQTKLYMAKYLLEKEVVSLYKRIDKDKAAGIYQKRLDDSWIKDSQIAPPEAGWFRKLFE